MAAEEELTHENVRTEVLNEVALRHPIVFDDFNLCDLHGSGKLQQLSVWDHDAVTYLNHIPNIVTPSYRYHTRCNAGE